MRFKPGQQVVCIKREPWVVVIGTPTRGDRDPKFNEIVTVEEYVSSFIILEEYPGNQGYGEQWFEPVVTSEQLAEDLEIAELVQACSA